MQKQGHRLSRAGYFLAVSTLIFVVAVGVLNVHAARADKADLVTVASDRQSRDPTIVINSGTAEIVDLKGTVADVMIADPSIVEVSVLQSNRLYIVGQAMGSTNLIAVDENGDVVERMNIHVTIDVKNVQRMIDRLFPSEDITVEALRAQIILRGTVSTADVASQVVNLMMHHLSEVEGGSLSANEAIVNLLKIRGKSQVMLRVKVLEVSRNMLRERSNDTEVVDIGGVLGNEFENSADLGGLFGQVVSVGTSETPFARFGLLESIGAFGPLDTIISLLEEEGLARLLAEPNLTAISGEQAGFLAGGEIPVPSGRDSEGNIEILFRRFGVSLSFQPLVMSDERISLQLETEVSALSREIQVTLADLQVPGLDVRRASTTVEMGSGTTLMIAGLLQSQTIKGLSGIPGMTTAPIIGDLMSSDSFRREETEMIVLVTPYIVEPFADKKQGDPVPAKEREQNKLADAFSNNIRRTYGSLRMSGVFDGDSGYGYLID